MQECTTTNPAAPDPKRRFLCRHVFTDGHRCGSPALRGEDLCYYHHVSRREPRINRPNGHFIMPRIDDRPAIQIALYDVLARIAEGDIELKRAGMLLYGLQIASSNLGKHQAAAANTEPLVEDITTSPFLGDLAPVAEIPTAETSGAPCSTASSSTMGLQPTEITSAATSNPQPTTFSPITLAAAHTPANLQPATNNLQLRPPEPRTVPPTVPPHATSYNGHNDSAWSGLPTRPRALSLPG